MKHRMKEKMKIEKIEKKDRKKLETSNQIVKQIVVHLVQTIEIVFHFRIMRSSVAHFGQSDRDRKNQSHPMYNN